MPIIERPSPNHGERRGGAIDILVLHYTGMESAEAALAWMGDPRSAVSSHYLVDEAGMVYRLVEEDRRAWHAGVSFWAGERDINSRSIGIEVQNPGHQAGLPAFPDKQIQALVTLCGGILARHAIPSARVLAHSDVAPGRKIDPGERFPWPTLAASGIGLWANPDPADADGAVEFGASGGKVKRLQEALAGFGYDVASSGRHDEKTALAVAAFQRHWRPERVDGRADRSTRAQLARIAALASA